MYQFNVDFQNVSLFFVSVCVWCGQKKHITSIRRFSFSSFEREKKTIYNKLKGLKTYTLVVDNVDNDGQFLVIVKKDDTTNFDLTLE